MAVIQPERLAAAIGRGLTAIVEITLDAQHVQIAGCFAQRVSADAAVQQCYRVPWTRLRAGAVLLRDMPQYHAAAQRLFTQDAQVRNVKAYFSVEREVRHRTAIDLNGATPSGIGLCGGFAQSVLADFVDQGVLGRRWGLGGLAHIAALALQSISDQAALKIAPPFRSALVIVQRIG